MEEIVFVTHNKGKAKSAEKYFDNIKFSTYLWYIFKPEHFEKTLAEMDAKEREERRKIDGSVEALKVFAEWYKNSKGDVK